MLILFHILFVLCTYKYICLCLLYCDLHALFHSTYIFIVYNSVICTKPFNNPLYFIMVIVFDIIPLNLNFHIHWMYIGL